MKKQYWFLSLIVVFICILAACSEKEKETSADAPNGGEPKAGGTVSMPITADPTFNTWHPNAYAESNVVNRIIFSGLTKPGKDLAPAPSLAKEWTTSEDGLVWTFTLRDDVKWHDGEQFTSEDVAFTFNNLVLNESLGSNGASNYKSLKEVVAVNDFTVEFHLERAWAALPSYLAFNSEIMPEHILGSVDDVWNYTEFNKKNPVGTGPFKVDNYLSGQSVTLVKNEEYFDGAPNLDKVVYKIVPDVNTQIAQALSNELDIFVLEDKASLARVDSANNLTTVPSDITRYFWISLNQEDERYQDVKVRQAVAHAIDRQAIIDSVLQGYGKIATGPITPNQEAYYTDDVKQYDYNVETAKALLKEAGWEDSNGDGFVDKNGEKFVINFDIAIQGDLEQIAQLVQQYLIKVGFDVKLNVLEWNAMIQKNIIERDYEMALNWWSYPTDPDVYAQYASENAKTGNNIPGYQSDELDELLRQGQTTSEIADRAEVYKKVQEYVAEELPYIYLWYPQEVQVRNKKLGGLSEIYFGANLNYINEWYINE